MSQQLHMPDIYEPLPAASDDSGLWLYGLSLALLAALALWRYRQQPLRRLQRELRRGHIDARSAAHRLAALKPSPELDRLRFAREAPSHAQLLTLLQEQNGV